MSASGAYPLVAVDVGNTQIKLGFFDASSAGLPDPRLVVSLSHAWSDETLNTILAKEPGEFSWFVASVNRPAASRLVAWLSDHGKPARLLDHTDLPLAVKLERPDHVGIDRLANAVAANRLRSAGASAILVDSGSAITIDLVDAEGAFVGGVILPGVEMAARALDEFTDLLPRVDVDRAPPVVGRSTVAAMESGLYWGTVGAVREIASRMAAESPAAQVFVSGGAAPLVIDDLKRTLEQVSYVPFLTLSGIALTAESLP